MTYWFNTPGIRDRAPIGSSETMKGLSSTFLIPKMFIGVNAIPERGGGIIRYIAPLCAIKRAFIIGDQHVAHLANRVGQLYRTAASPSKSGTKQNLRYHWIMSTNVLVQ